MQPRELLLVLASSRAIATAAGAQKASRAVTPPESVSDLISWLEKIGEDDATFILVDRPAASDGGE